MINTDRIVPVTVTDLISLYAFIVKAAGTTLTVLDAENTLGDFEVDSASTALIASEPLRSLNFTDDVSSATVYFVPTLDYEGFSIDGTDVTTAGVIVTPDGRTLYSAALSSGTVTITKQSF